MQLGPCAPRSGITPRRPRSDSTSDATSRPNVRTCDTGIDGENPVDIDELDLVLINPPSYVWYQDMVDFAEGVSDRAAGERLCFALQGKGAFRRFRDELRQWQPDLLSAWRTFSDAIAQIMAVNWLADEGIVDPEAAKQFVCEHPLPDLP